MLYMVFLVVTRVVFKKKPGSVPQVYFWLFFEQWTWIKSLDLGVVTKAEVAKKINKVPFSCQEIIQLTCIKWLSLLCVTTNDSLLMRSSFDLYCSNPYRSRPPSRRGGREGNNNRGDIKSRLGAAPFNKGSSGQDWFKVVVSLPCYYWFHSLETNSLYAWSQFFKPWASKSTMCSILITIWQHAI